MTPSYKKHKGRGKLETFRAQSLFMCGFLADLLFVLNFTKNFVRFFNTATYWLMCLFIGQVGFYTLISRYLAFRKFAHAQKFDLRVILCSGRPLAVHVLPSHPRTHRFFTGRRFRRIKSPVSGTSDIGDFRWRLNSRQTENIIARWVTGLRLPLDY